MCLSYRSYQILHIYFSMNLLGPQRTLWWADFKIDYTLKRFTLAWRYHEVQNVTTLITLMGSFAVSLFLMIFQAAANANDLPIEYSYSLCAPLSIYV